MMREKTTVNMSGEKLTYWRSVDNRRRTKEYIASLENEFASDMTDITHVNRRSMLKYMGASVALAGIGVSCRRPEEKILPYVKAPEDITPGIPNFFATSQSSPFGAQGLLVESHEGRPTKVEGNPQHPHNLGKASFINQASVLDVYDPDRSKYCISESRGDFLPKTLEEFDTFLGDKLELLKETKGEGLGFLCGLDVSPSFLRLKNIIKRRFPKVKFYIHEPMRQINVEQANEISFGEKTVVKYDFSKAKILVSLFSDPFSFGPDHINLQRGFSHNRKLYSIKDKKRLNRLYSVEADYSLTGLNADHRLRTSMGLAKRFIHALAFELAANHNIDFVDKALFATQRLGTIFKMPPSYKGLDKSFIRILAKDLADNQGQALLYPSEKLEPGLIAMVNVINVALKNLNSSMNILRVRTEAKEYLSTPGIHSLVENIERKQISTLFILGTNPVYTAPRNLDIAEKLKSIPTTVHLGLHRDETGSICKWHVPESHFLEYFNDDVSFDGTISLSQPLIKPLYPSKSKLELIAQIANVKDTNTRDIIQQTFMEKYNDYTRYRKSLHDGFVADSQYEKVLPVRLDVKACHSWFLKAKERNPSLKSPELIVNYDRKILDGRLANNSWLQELPDPVTKLNWDNALLMSPHLARELKIKSGLKKNAYMADMVKVTANNKSVELPVFVMPGLSDFSLSVALGYGRTQAGKIGNNIGFDAQDLLAGNEKIISVEALSSTGKQFKLSSTQEQFAMNAETVQEIDTFSMQSRDPARVADLKEYLKNPSYAKNKGLSENLLVKENGKKVPLQITDAWDYSKNNQWGMVIDLSKCTGCSSCIIACQSENNIPIVGKEQVIKGRMMHWLRVDRYFTGDVKAPKSISQPVVCQHCENAPCEPVCPVAATVHDKEGLNAMTYNRCIGTRYCANNCPFKVRRFNYFDFTNTGNLYVASDKKKRQETLQMQRNPDVTVRYRGVMEKCTFCTQRIQEAKMLATREGKDSNNLKDGSVIPACAQTCPSEAITFGNINDKNSEVFRLKNIDRNYTMLDVLNVRPRTSYLSKVRNPHPDLV